MDAFRAALALGSVIASVALPQPQPGDDVVVFESAQNNCRYRVYGSPEGLVVAASRPSCAVLVGHEREAAR